MVAMALYVDVQVQRDHTSVASMLPPLSALPLVPTANWKWNTTGNSNCKQEGEIERREQLGTFPAQSPSIMEFLLEKRVPTSRSPYMTDAMSCTKYYYSVVCI